MAKMKFKLDMPAVKQFLFEKGEKVGLVACVAIMVLVVAYALYSGFTARGNDRGESWDIAIDKAARQVNQGVANASLADDKVADFNPKGYGWVALPYGGQYLPLFSYPDRGGNKKMNPFALPIVQADEDNTTMQLKYYACGTYAWSIDTGARMFDTIVGAGEKGGAAGGGAMVGPMGGMTKGAAQQQASSSNVAKQVRPTHMVVVSAIFPMQDQLVEFKKALRYLSVEELLTHRNELPHPIGLEVSRNEMLPNGQWVGWKPLYHFDSKGNPTAIPAIRDMMLRMLVDEEEQFAASQYIFPGLVTPLPKLANPGARYAKVELKGFNVKPPEVVADVGTGVGAAAGGEKPMGGAAAYGKGMSFPGMGKKGPAMGEKGDNQPGATATGSGQNLSNKREPWSKLADQQLRSKFLGNFDIFDPLAHGKGKVSAEKKGNIVGPGGQQASGSKDGVWGWDLLLSGAGGGSGTIGGGKEVGPTSNPMKGEDDENKTTAAPTTAKLEIDGALVRFFDPTVEPGRTYCYTIRAKIANPNFGKNNEVAFLALANQKELEPMPTVTKDNGWVRTPLISIPIDYHWYSVDQVPEHKHKNGPDWGNPPQYIETAPVQVHRWVDKVTDANGDTVAADWALAERFYLRRGEPLGRMKVMVEIPTWQYLQQTWTIGFSLQAAIGKPKTTVEKMTPTVAGVPVDFLTAPTALLVDFEGGRKTFYEKRDGAKDYLNDSSTVDILALTQDGRLVVRSSRTDAEFEERRNRFEDWRERVNLVRAGPGATGGPAMPGANPGGGR